MTSASANQIRKYVTVNKEKADAAEEMLPDIQAWLDAHDGDQRTRYCVICGKTFLTMDLWQTTCSSPCDRIFGDDQRIEVNRRLWEDLPQAIQVLNELDNERVYFIQASKTGHIKIGYSRSPQQRLAALQIANPEGLELLGSIHGDERLEAILHAEFADARVSGEWFEPTDSLLAFIQDALDE